MKEPKLIYLLNTLHKQEWESLLKFVAVHHEKQTDNYQLVCSLQTQFGQQKKLDSSEVHELHFTHLTQKGFSNLLSRVFKLAQEWLVYYDCQQHEIGHKIKLLQAYNVRGAYELANQLYPKIEKQLNDQRALSLQKNDLLNELYHSQYYSDNPIKYKEKTLLKKLVDCQFSSIADQSMLYQVEMHNWGFINNIDYSISIEQLKHLQNSFPLTQNRQVLELLQSVSENKDVEALQTLSERLLSNTILPKDELHTLVSLYSLNYALRFYKAGQLSLDLIYSLYDYCFESGVLMHRGKIPEVRFLNVIATISASKTKVEMHVFIEKWISFVDTNNHEELEMLAKAEVSVHQETYHDIIPLLRTVTYNQVSSRLKAMCLECIALFKADERDDDILTYKIQNSKRFLRRHKSELSNALYESCWNLFTIISLLLRANYKELTIDVSKYQYLLHRRWVTNELKRKR